MDCNGKKCFSKKDCQSKLNSLINSGEWSAKQKGRIYHCPECNWYHLTSLMGEGKVDMRGVQIALKDKWIGILKKQKRDELRVTFQQATELRNKGYNAPCKHWYTLNKKLIYSEIPKNFNALNDSCSAPTMEEYRKFKNQLKLKKPKRHDHHKKSKPQMPNG